MYCFFIFHLKGNGQYVKAKKESQIEAERKGRESKFLTLKKFTGFYKTLKLFTEPEVKVIDGHQFDVRFDLPNHFIN